MHNIVKLSLFALIISSQVNAKCTKESDCKPGYTCKNKNCVIKPNVKIHYKPKPYKPDDSVSRSVGRPEDNIQDKSNYTEVQPELVQRKVGSHPAILNPESKKNN